MGENMVLASLLSFTFGIVGSIFTILDTSNSNLDGYSILDLMIVLLLIDMILDFIYSVMGAQYNPDDILEE